MRTDKLLCKSSIKTTTRTTGPWLDAFNAYRIAYCHWPTPSVDRTLPAPVQAIPADQRSLWEGVARSAANAKLDPDLYVWRLTRDVSCFRYAADLRGAAAEKEARSTTDMMLSRHANGFQSFLVEARNLWTEVVVGGGMFDALMAGGSWPDIDYSPKIDLVFRWNMCFIRKPPPANPSDPNYLRENFHAALRWLADENNNSNVVHFLEHAACAKLWARRDIYSACSWLNQRLIPLARKIFFEKICCLEPPRQEKSP